MQTSSRNRGIVNPTASHGTEKEDIGSFEFGNVIAARAE